MSTIPAPADAIAESQRLIAALERRRAELPFVDVVLEAHRTMHQELEVSHSSSEQAVAEWRAALARRWECEVAGRRLYRQIMRQLAEGYRTEAPAFKVISRGGAEAESSPAQLLEDLSRLQAALSISGVSELSRLRGRQLEELSLELAHAIGHADSCEHRRRSSALDNRMVREVYRRVRGETCRALVGHYGDDLPFDLRCLFEQY
ncbi:MAG: hypothetical protein RLZZ387_4427 [Chloroflexota bacterium]|jgi:hypothetical protein